MSVIDYRDDTGLFFCFWQLGLDAEYGFGGSLRAGVERIWGRLVVEATSKEGVEVTTVRALACVAGIVLPEVVGHDAGGDAKEGIDPAVFTRSVS